MNRNKFKEAFRRGLGSAYLELKNCDHIDDYKDIVLWCCLHNTCYDMQCEGGRSNYLYNAINLFEDKIFFEEAIIMKFQNEIWNIWLFDQLCELLFQFALNGSINARKALYEKYDALFESLSRNRNRDSICTERDSFEWLCVRLISLDRFKVFKRIVGQIGEFYLKSNNSNSIIMDWFYSNAQQKFGKTRVDNYMRINAQRSKAIEAFLNQIESFDIEKPKAMPVPSLNELVKSCYDSSGYHSRGIANRFSKIASLEELTELAKIAITETNPEIKLGLLWTFRKRPFPLDESYIFELIESNEESIRDIAFEMMGQLSSDKIHDYAISLITEEKEMANALSLLCHCYKSEDESLLDKNIKKLTVSYGSGLWHGVYNDVEDLLKLTSCRIKASIFIYMYKHTLCSVCRSSLIRTMYKRKILPIEVLEECLYDSYADTRKFASKKLQLQNRQL